MASSDDGRGKQFTLGQSGFGNLKSHKRTHANGPQAGTIGVFFIWNPAGAQVDGAEKNLNRNMTENEGEDGRRLEQESDIGRVLRCETSN